MTRVRLVSAALLGAALVAAAGWDSFGNRSNPRPPPAPPHRRPPAPAKPSRLSAEEAEHLLGRILSRIQDDYRRTFRGGGCGTLGPWLSEDRSGNGPKARLFARAYPELAKRRVLEILEDPEAPAPDRHFALQMLGSVEEWTSDRLEEALRSLVELGDEGSAYLPLWELGRRDPGLRHIDLYHRECHRGNLAAFQILSFTFQRTSVALFEQLMLQSRNRHRPLGSIPDEAEDGLRRLRILQSDRWAETVERMLRVPPKAGSEDYYEIYRDFGWACEVAVRRGLPSLLDCLAERARTQPAGGDTRSDDADRALAKFGGLGGELTPSEFGRLRQNGFVGDAEERLLEIVREEGIR